MTIALIRNAGSAGDIEGRRMGLLDESISPGGRERLLRKIDAGAYPDAQMVFTGGLSRCLDTARSIYPRVPAIVLRELSPFDFGVFSGLTVREITESEPFRIFFSGCDIKVPPGGSEDHYSFLTRCGQAFLRIAREAQDKGAEMVSVVTHLAVIRTILRRYHVPRAFYRDWRADFCGGFLCEFGERDGMLRVKREI
ncbi:MAG: phosphoglycerate mutase family protein [Oscillospiraceae bacterium]|jgi:alpha-ribazole phosphatase|nr:phosphoglycerate mutase family protein [Oscillospiraceae bacterium]